MNIQLNSKQEVSKYLLLIIACLICHNQRLILTLRIRWMPNPCNIIKFLTLATSTDLLNAQVIITEILRKYTSCDSNADHTFIASRTVHKTGTNLSSNAIIKRCRSGFDDNLNGNDRKSYRRCYYG